MLPACALDHGKRRFQMHTFLGEDVFGGPRWRDLVGPEQADAYYKSGAVPLMLDPDGHSVKRNFVHVSDLADAILKALDNPRARQETFNICMDEPVDYQQVADYLRQTRGLPCVEIKTPTIRPGWTIRKRNFFWAGGLAMISSA